MAQPAASTQIFGCRRTSTHCGLVIINNSRDQCLCVQRRYLPTAAVAGRVGWTRVRQQVGGYNNPHHLALRSPSPPAVKTLAESPTAPVWGNQSRIYDSSTQCVTACVSTSISTSAPAKSIHLRQCCAENLVFQKFNTVSVRKTRHPVTSHRIFFNPSVGLKF